MFNFHILHFISHLSFPFPWLGGVARLDAIALFKITASEWLNIFIICIVLVISSMMFLIDVIIIVS